MLGRNDDKPIGHYQTVIAMLTFLGDKNKIDSLMPCVPARTCFCSCIAFHTATCIMLNLLPTLRHSG